MRVINVLINILDIIFFVLLAENRLKQTKTGEQLFNRFESGIYIWTHTRANAEILAEVLALQKFFGGSIVVIFLVLILLTNLPFQNLLVVQQIIVSLRISFFIALVGWGSLDWTFQHRATIRNFIRNFMGFKIIFAFATALVFAALTIKPALEPVFIELWKAKGFGVPSIYQVNFFISLFSGTALILFIFLFYIFNWLFFGSLSFLIVGMIYATSLLSKLVIRTVNRDAALALVVLAEALIRSLKNFL